MSIALARLQSNDILAGVTRNVSSEGRHWPSILELPECHQVFEWRAPTRPKGWPWRVQDFALDPCIWASSVHQELEIVSTNLDQLNQMMNYKVTYGELLRRAAEIDIGEIVTIDILIARARIIMEHLRQGHIVHSPARTDSSRCESDRQTQCEKHHALGSLVLSNVSAGWM